MQKSSKGYTIVELLIVIGLILVIFLIATGAVYRVVNKSRDEYMVSQHDQIVLAAEDYFTYDRSRLPSNSTSDSVRSVSLNTLINDKYINDVSDSSGQSCKQESKAYARYTVYGTYEYSLYLKCGDAIYTEGDVPKVIQVIPTIVNTTVSTGMNIFTGIVVKHLEETIGNVSVTAVIFKEGSLDKKRVVSTANNEGVFINNPSLSSLYGNSLSSGNYIITYSSSGMVSAERTVAVN